MNSLEVANDLLQVGYDLTGQVLSFEVVTDSSSGGH